MPVVLGLGRSVAPSSAGMVSSLVIALSSTELMNESFSRANEEIRFWARRALFARSLGRPDTHGRSQSAYAASNCEKMLKNPSGSIHAAADESVSITYRPEPCLRPPQNPNTH